jgi:acyl carrier protein
MLQPDVALTALGTVLQENLPQSMIASANWSQMADVLGEFARPLLTDLTETNGWADAAESDAFLREFDRTPDDSRIGLITRLLQSELVRILSLSEPPDTGQSIFDLGLDSLMSVELRNRLQRLFGDRLELSSTVVFDYPTIDALADQLTNELSKREDVSRPASSDTQPATHATDVDAEASIDDLLDDELTALLDQRIHQLLDPER